MFVKVGRRCQVFDPKLLGNVPFKKWTECQEKVFALTGRENVAIQSFTGSGKTIAYLVPAIQRLVNNDGKVAVVVVPTRELARQVGAVVQPLLRGFESHIDSRVLCAGETLSEPCGSGRIIVATPGALINNLSFLNASSVGSIVIDEVDRLVDFGFIGQLEIILNSLAVARPRLMVASATFSRETELICRRILGKNFVRIRSSASVPPGLSNEIIQYEPLRFLDTLGQVITHRMTSGNQGLVLFPTTRSLMFFYSRYKTGLDAVGRLGAVHALHGRMVDSKRKIISEKFTNFDSSNSQLLFSTDVAARGLDFPNLSFVCQVGFSGVDDPVAQYVHRSGRTARGGSSGHNVLLVGKGIDAESRWVKDLQSNFEKPEKNEIFSTGNSIFNHECSPYQRHLSTKCLESLLSWYIERKSMLGLSGGDSSSPEGKALERKANLVKAVIDMVRSAGVPEPIISSKLAKKLRIDDIPGIHISDRR